MDWLEIFETQFGGNSVRAYALSLAVCAAAWVLISVAGCLLQRHLRELETRTAGLARFYQMLKDALWPVLYFGALLFSARDLKLPESLLKLAQAGLIAIATFQVTRIIAAVSGSYLEETFVKKRSSFNGMRFSSGFLTVLRFVIWSLGIIFLLANLGVNISAVLAGLGIGGIAVALASQTILGDLFNYFVIFFDKPFEEDDFIAVDDYMGTIEHIGIKTTKIRSLDGEQIILPNTSLTSSRIRNYKRMEKRRVLMKLGVTYETSGEKVKRAVEIMRAQIQAHQDTLIDRIHFVGFGDSALNLEAAFYILQTDYVKCMDTRQEINFGIMQAFRSEGIEFAYPTQTVYHKQL